jgi:hypothetical protein
MKINQVAPGMDALKTENGYQLIELSASNIPSILELEKACWLPQIRADAQTLNRRFAQGHISLGMCCDDELVGIVSFYYTQFSLDESVDLPKSFQEFSTLPMAHHYNTAFAYNFNIHPRARGGALTRLLLDAGLSRMREDDCRYLLGVSRCPSYNGSSNGKFEYILQSAELRNALDAFMLSGLQPTTKQLLEDPVLRFYHQALGCEFLRVVPQFLPRDTPSGGFGVIFAKKL